MARARNTLSTKGFHPRGSHAGGTPPPPGPEGRRQTRSWLGWQRGRGKASPPARCLGPGAWGWGKRAGSRARGGTRPGFPGREKKRSLSVASAIITHQAGLDVPGDPPRSPDHPGSLGLGRWPPLPLPLAPGCLGGGEIRGSGSFLFPRLPGGYIIYITGRSQGSKQRTGPLPDEPTVPEFPKPLPGPLLLSLASPSHTGPELVFLATCQSLQGLARGQ